MNRSHRSNINIVYSIPIMRASFVIAAAIATIIGGVSADRPLKPQSQGDVVIIPNAELAVTTEGTGTASFTVNIDGTVTIDIMWEDAAHALISGEDGKYKIYIIHIHRIITHILKSHAQLSCELLYLNCVTIIISECKYSYRRFPCRSQRFSWTNQCKAASLRR